MKPRILHGDCLERLATLPEASVDSVVTDPPYGLEFMGKEWDAPWRQTSGGFSATGIGERATPWPSYKGSNRSRCATCGLLVGHGGSPCRCEKPRPVLQDADRMRAFQAWCEGWARAVFRVLKPGGHLLAFGGTRTSHRMVCAIEDAGFEVRDSLVWLHGQGFPKSLNVGKAIAAGGGPESIRRLSMGDEYKPSGRGRVNYDHGGGSAMNGTTAPVALPPEAAKWEGWGTALKPAHEPICLARKPLEGTVAANVQAHGTGALNVDGCRIATSDDLNGGGYTPRAQGNAWAETGGMNKAGASADRPFVQPSGRWPANVTLDEEAARLLDEMSGERTSGKMKAGTPRGTRQGNALGLMPSVTGDETHGDSGGASRFFYCAKPSRKERGEGNNHPTVKPVKLMRWLVRLVTPPGGLVLDPFLGSGTTALAARAEGFRFLGIEREAAYVEIAEKRLQLALFQEAA